MNTTSSVYSRSIKRFFARPKKILPWIVYIGMIYKIIQRTGFEVFKNDVQLLFKEQWQALMFFYCTAAILANTPLDRLIFDYGFKLFNQNRGFKTVLYYAKRLVDRGSVFYIPILYAILILNAHSLTPWALYNTWNLFEGFGLYLLSTLLLSAKRPENHQDSHWFQTSYFRDIYAVSGHALLGAFPFIALANSISFVPAKITLYLLSCLPGLSRIQTNAHFPSQILLGWAFAYLTGTRVRTNVIANEDTLTDHSDLAQVLGGCIINYHESTNVERKELDQESIVSQVVNLMKSGFSYVKNFWRNSQQEMQRPTLEPNQKKATMEETIIFISEEEEKAEKRASSHTQTFLGWAFSYINISNSTSCQHRGEILSRSSVLAVEDNHTQTQSFLGWTFSGMRSSLSSHKEDVLLVQQNSVTHEAKILSPV